MALAGQVLDGRPGVADGDLLEGHDVPQRAQGVLAAEDALEVAESVLVQEADDGAYPCRVGEDADAVVAVEEGPGEPCIGLETGAGHPQARPVVQVQAQGLTMSWIAMAHALPLPVPWAAHSQP